MRRVMLLVLMTAGVVVQAMPIKTQMLKPRAFYQEADNNLLEALDLKAKTLHFRQSELDECGANMARQAHTLNFSCTLMIPSKARISKLQNLVTGSQREVVFGGTKRLVQVRVSPDARTLTLSTGFDATGFDFDVSKFNDDFVAVYAKVAHLVFSDALKNKPIRIEVLEGR